MRLATIDEVDGRHMRDRDLLDVIISVDLYFTTINLCQHSRAD